VEHARAEADKSLKQKYGLPAELALERADDPNIVAEARDEWERGRAARAGESTSRKRRLALEAPVLLPAPPRRGASASKQSAASSLRARILSNSARRTAAGAAAAGIDALIPPPTSRKGTGGLAAGIALRKS